MWQVLCDNIGSSTPTPKCVEVCKFIAECVIWEAFQQLAQAALFQYPTLNPPDYRSDNFELDVELIEE
jgi:ribosomal protein S26